VTDTALDRILEALASAPRQHRLIALGWATVDTDRAAAELAAELGLTAGAFLPAADSIVLGARCRVVDGVLSGGPRLAILEPVTEGLLAAALARHDEGPSVTWMQSSDTPGGRASALLRPGPFGPERLQLGGPPQGPFVLLIEHEPGTIHT
jgi:hypothetical protein